MPTNTYSVTAGGDDGYIDAEGSTGSTWPPDGAKTVVTGGTTVSVRKAKFAGFTDLIVCLMRFDTSSLPDGATINSAILRLQIVTVGNITNRNLVVGYYANANFPIDAADWDGADNPGSDAGTFALTGFSASTQIDLTLTNVSSINTTGNTGFRLGIDGGIPSTNNDNYFIEIAAFDHVTLTEPQLLVTYNDSGRAGLPRRQQPVHLLAR
jgi:hypothetical protein